MNSSKMKIFNCDLRFLFLVSVLSVNHSSAIGIPEAEKLQSAFSKTFIDQPKISECPMHRMKRELDDSVENSREQCVEPVMPCDLFYRTVDGTCNNLKHKRWGAVNTCYRRLLPAKYADGRSEPISGRPNSGEFSLKLQALPANTSVSKLTHLFFAYGQLLAHEMIGTVTERVEGGCCEHRDLPECSMTVDVSKDPFYAKRNVDCINFVRSAQCPCQMDEARQHMNSVTSYIDMSVVYGTSPRELEQLRDPRSPHLLYMSERNILPLVRGHGCVSEQCFVSGDFRVNAIPMLTALHIVWARYHNYLARNLRHVNKHWESSKVFYEARKIAIAQFQLTIYGEYLPLLIGPKTMREHRINHINTGYNPRTEAAIYTDFASATFRLHSQIPDDVNGIPVSFFNNGYFFNKSYSDFTGDVVEAMASTRGRKFQFPMSETSFHRMYHRGEHGLNMIALSTQRGRDHGLPPYIDYVHLATGFRIKSFEDLFLARLMSEKSAALLEDIYGDVSLVDLYIGGSLETPLEGATYGRTFAFMAAIQFKDLAEGDRFFGRNGGFTKAQWKEVVKKTSLGRIICLATGRKFQRYPFLMDSTLEDCTTFQLDFKLWI